MRHLQYNCRVPICFFPYFICAALIFTFCGNSSSKNDTESDEPAEPAHCETNLELVGIEDVTPLGYSAQEVIDTLWGTWQCDELEWGDVDSGGALYPTEKPDSVTISQSYEKGDIFFNSSVRVGGNENTDLLCPTQLEIPSVIRMESSDGVFSETISGTAIVSEKKMQSTVIVEYTPSRDFSGSYNFVPNPDLEELPYSGTIIRFTTQEIDASQTFASGRIIEYFRSESYVDTDDYPMLESWGAGFVTVNIICRNRDDG
jgi:hypothetical protein